VGGGLGRDSRGRVLGQATRLARTRRRHDAAPSTDRITLTAGRQTLTESVRRCSLGGGGEGGRKGGRDLLQVNSPPRPLFARFANPRRNHPWDGRLFVRSCLRPGRSQGVGTARFFLRANTIGGPALLEKVSNLYKTLVAPPTRLWRTAEILTTESTLLAKLNIYLLSKTCRQENIKFETFC